MPPLPLFLLGLGVLLLFIEIILLPGFGAAGVPAIILICVGIGIVWWNTVGTPRRYTLARPL